MRSRLRVVVLGVVSLALVMSVVADPAAAKRKAKPHARPLGLTVRLAGPTAALVGQPVTLTVSVVVPRGDRVTSYVLLWGDGSKPLSGKRRVPGAVRHLFTRSGSFTVSVLVASKRATARTSRVIRVAPAAVAPPSSPPSGTLSLWAGTTRAITPGPATAMPVFASGIAVDGSGNVFVSDDRNSLVVKVSPSGALSIVAGTGTAGAPVSGPATSSPLNAPSGVAVDSAGDVYVADTGNNRVEKVTPAGTLSVIAGNGTRGAPIAGPATSSPLAAPAGLTVDSAGDVLIADSLNSRVEKVTPSGTLSIIAGNGTYGAPVAGPATSSPLSTPSGVAVDFGGNMFIADQDVVEKVTPGGTLTLFAGISGQSSAPRPGPATSTTVTPLGVAVNSAGDVLIADGWEVVEKITPSGTLSVIVGNGQYGPPVPGPATSSPLGSPQGVAVDPAGTLFIADRYNSVVERVTSDGMLGVYAGRAGRGSPAPGPGASSPLWFPRGVTLDSAGDVFIADSRNNRVEKVAPDGTLSILAGNGAAGAPVAGPATSSPLNTPWGIAVDSAGDVFIADSGNSRVEEVAPDGTLRVIAGNGTFGAPVAGPATSSPLKRPSGLALDSAGNLYVADSDNNVVERVTTGGTLSVVAGNGSRGPAVAGSATSSPLSAPLGVTLDPSGDIFIADSGNNRVEMVSPAGMLSYVAGNGTQGPSVAGPATSSPLQTPSGVALTSGGSLLIADTYNSVVDKVTPDGTLSVLAGTGVDGLPRLGPASSSPLKRPSGIAVNSAGDLFIADTWNNDVERVLRVA